MNKFHVTVIAVFCIIFISFFIGLTDTPDSFGYVALGNYLYSRQVTQITPFNETRPQTLFGPLYGLIATPLFQLPAPMGSVLITSIQLALLCASALLIWKAAKNIFPKPWPLITATVFLLLPFNLIYATFMMSETLTQFFIALFLYILSGLRNRTRVKTFSLLTLVGALTTLARYGYILLFAGAFVGWVLAFFSGEKTCRCRFLASGCNRVYWNCPLDVI